MITDIFDTTIDEMVQPDGVRALLNSHDAREAFAKAIGITEREYGEDFGEMETRWTDPDIKITVYRK